MSRTTDRPRSQEPRDPVTVFIIDEDRLLAEALGQVLTVEEFAVSGIASPGPGAIDDVRRSVPDVVILGVDTPTSSDMSLGRMIVDVAERSRILVLASNVDRSHVRDVSRAGLHGCMLKDVSVSELVRAVHALARGGTSAPPNASDAFRATVDDAADPPSARLTPRELEVLKLVARGAAGRTIARRLGISENTVRTHSQSILEKLELHSRLEAAAYAIGSGLVRFGSPEENELAG